MKWASRASAIRLAAIGAVAVTLPSAILFAHEGRIGLVLLACEIGVLAGVSIFGLAYIRNRLLDLPTLLLKNDANLLQQCRGQLFLQSVAPPEALLLQLGGMAINADFAAQFVWLLHSRRPKLVVELGSGVSTVLCALMLQTQGFGRIVSIDHESNYADTTRTRLRYFGLQKLAEVRNAPLSQVDIEGESFPWYDPSLFVDLHDINLLVVDGPPGWLATNARFPALPLLMNRLSANTAILLDDASREDETCIVDAWLQRWPSFKRFDFPTRNGATLLVRDADPHKCGP
jgi:Methyltransferase domain